ncbi:MAG TPA: hypothetical protein VKC57_09970, partial [Ktedonobacterales bacterium]|nr:hypothetical protein [Ktedonobacterales bacterium]
VEEIASDLKLTVKQVENALFDIHRKKATTEFLRTPPLAPAPMKTRAVDEPEPYAARLHGARRAIL